LLKVYRYSHSKRHNSELYKTNSERQTDRQTDVPRLLSLSDPFIVRLFHRLSVSERTTRPTGHTTHTYNKSAFRHFIPLPVVKRLTSPQSIVPAVMTRC